jgi:capsular polysaccharide biosynthesis protein
MHRCSCQSLSVGLISLVCTTQKNVGRVLGNEQEVVNVLNSGNMMKVNVVDLAGMSYKDQLTLVRSSNVLVGVHGAGLMNIMFAAEEVSEIRDNVYKTLSN